MKLVILMYHYVREIQNSDYPLIKGLEFECFKRQLNYLEANYNIISAEQLTGFAQGVVSLPDNPCLLTFDDGFKDHYKYVLPELLKRDLKGSFFPPVKPVVEREMLDVHSIHFILACRPNYESLVGDLKKLCLVNGVSHHNLEFYWNTYAIASRYDPKEVTFIKRMLQHVLPEPLRNTITDHLFKTYVCRSPKDFANELYMSVEDTKQLVKCGLYVGSHGYRHLWLNKETKNSQENEIDLSLNFLKEVGSSATDWIMCYPYGAYNADTLSILKRKNCCLGLTTKAGIVELRRDNLLELSRFDTNDFSQ